MNTIAPTFRRFAITLLLTSLSSLLAQPGFAQQRFGLRYYNTSHGKVVVEAATDKIVLRTQGPAAEDFARLLVQQTLQLVDKRGTTNAAPEGSRRLRSHGLYLVQLTDALAPKQLQQLSKELRQHPQVLQAYPVLRRSTGRAFYDDHIIVTAQPGQLQALLEKVLPLVDGTLVRRALVPDTALVQVGAVLDHDAVDASRLLARQLPDQLLRAAEPDLYRELGLKAQTNDPRFPDQWHLWRGGGANIPGTGQIYADKAWDITMGDPQVVVAILDSGIDIDHEDLAGKLVGGFDAAAGDDDPRPECSASQDGRDTAASCPSQKPYRESHGTAVSGTAVGQGDNNIGVTGVCPQCSLMPVRLLGTSDVASGLSSGDAFMRAVNDGAWVLNNSWGVGFSRYFPLSQAEQDALHYARYQGRNGKGTVVLFASGNDTADVSTDSYSRQTDVITVGGTTNLDDWAYYSNYGEEVDISAPTRGGIVDEDSHGILTSDVTGNEGYDASSYHTDFGGTSASSPVVAGVAGLILSVNPELTADQVRIILTQTADKVRADKVDWEQVWGQNLEALWDYDPITGHSLAFGWGRVNAHAAVVAAMRPPLQGADCSVFPCTMCDANNRCQRACTFDSDCPDGSLCRAGACENPVPAPTDIGQLCVDDCDYCLNAMDSEFYPVSVCTRECQSQDDCPAGFDCRLMPSGDISLCAIGQPAAGEPQDFRNCVDDMYGASIVVRGQDGQKYCSDICIQEGDGACPYGFHCGYATCNCTADNGYWCYEYTCTEVNNQQQADWSFPQCFVTEAFGVTCQGDQDCKVGDYCNAKGECQVDDREGCYACQPCTRAYQTEECGPRGMCLDPDDGGGARCVRACEADDSCPGDSVCREVALRWMSLWLCISPEPGPNSSMCDPDYSCAVSCRDDIPCGQGEICNNGACEPKPEEEKKKEDPKPKGGCDCSATTGSSGAILVVGLIAVLLRRRR